MEMGMGGLKLQVVEAVVVVQGTWKMEVMMREKARLIFGIVYRLPGRVVWILIPVQPRYTPQWAGTMVEKKKVEGKEGLQWATKGR